VDYGSQKNTLDLKDAFEDGVVPEWQQSATASDTEHHKLTLVSATSLKRSG
jgi:hypothetical protein